MARRGIPVRAADLLREVYRYRSVFRATRGGITLSGGEVLQQPAFAAHPARGGEFGVHTALDTSGYLGRNAADELLGDVDLVLLDVKAGDEETYKRVTGRGSSRRWTSAAALTPSTSRCGCDTCSSPDSPTTRTASPGWLLDYAASLCNVTRVEVLPFHQMGRDKWHEIGMKYQLEDYPTPSLELTEATARHLPRPRLTSSLLTHPAHAVGRVAGRRRRLCHPRFDVAGGRDRIRRVAPRGVWALRRSESARVWQIPHEASGDSSSKAGSDCGRHRDAECGGRTRLRVYPEGT